MIGCGKVFSVIEIVLNADTPETRHDSVVRRITSVMEKFKVEDYLIQYTSGEIRQLATNGDSIGAKGSTGTLGAFVQATEMAHDDKTNVTGRPFYVALTAGHVAFAQKSKELFLDDKHFANILDVHSQTQTEIKVDIAAAEVLNKCLYNCTQKFKTMENCEAPCQLSGHFHSLEGEVVHIWGATSKPGVGRVKSVDFSMGNGDNILITDISGESVFALPGDSGSIVCKTSKDNKLEAIAMLTGSFKPQGKYTTPNYEYLALKLTYGIRFLETELKLKLKWFGNGKIHSFNPLGSI